MSRQSILLATVFVPLIGAFFLPFLGRVSRGGRNAGALLLVAVALAGSLMLAPGAMKGEVVCVTLGSAAFPLDLKADVLAVFVAAASSLISLIIVLYSTGYISHYRHQNEYYLMVVLFLGAMMGLVFSSNLLLLYVFWEITGIASWRLIGFFREKDYVIRADKAFVVTAFGALAMLLGFVMLYAQAGSFDLGALSAYYSAHSLPGLAVALILLGILSKSATLPLHTWLPDAGVAPSPVTSLLHAAVLVKIGVYAYARLFVAAMPLDPAWQTTVLVIAGLSALVSAGATLIETDMKRIIAYSTISQIAFIFLGFASGSEVGVAGALLYILMHGLAKGALFLCAGIIEQNTHTKDIRQMGGLVRTMPWTAAAFLVSAFSVMGVPPFGGFFGKFFVIGGAVAGGRLWIAMVFVAGAFLTILYLLRLFNALFLGEALIPAKEGSRVMVACVLALAVLSLLGGVLINVPSDFAHYVAGQVPGLVR